MMSNSLISPDQNGLACKFQDVGWVRPWPVLSNSSLPVALTLLSCSLIANSRAVKSLTNGSSGDNLTTKLGVSILDEFLPRLVDVHDAHAPYPGTIEFW